MTLAHAPLFLAMALKTQLPVKCGIQSDEVMLKNSELSNFGSCRENKFGEIGRHEKILF